ncbi:transcription repressor ofp6 [Nicotiana attenuata]|uniref:Transcription repressor n=1 Tax=Nicotiana attenuata TaxID=49451 RepID=A0A314KSK5_NICAT|nr:transcription repressor ofp6 [Nicotiana attenuata]
MMSSKSKKKWNFGKLFISNGVGCSGCRKPNSVDILEPNPKPKSKIPILTNQSPKICHTSSSFGEFNDNDLDEDDHTSITFSINIDSLSPSSSNQNDSTNLSPSEANSKSRVSLFPEIRGGIAVVRNSDDPFQDNFTSTTLCTNIDSLSKPIFDQNNDTNISPPEANSEFRVTPFPKICDGVIVVKNSDGPFQDNFTSTTLCTNIDSLSPPISDQTNDTNISPPVANSEFRVTPFPKIWDGVIVVKNSDGPFQDNHTSTTFSTNISSLSPPIFNQNNDTNLSRSEVNSESKVSSYPKIRDVTVVKNSDDPFQDNHTSNTFSTNIDSLSPPTFDQNDDINFLLLSEANSEFRASSCPKIHGSVAVVKDSSDPFQDFKKSMLQMIFEMEIYSPEDLKELLNCFLHLNSPSYHEIIIQAFLNICAN